MAIMNNGVDIGTNLVSKQYLFQVYPSLSNVIKSPALWGWGWNLSGMFGTNNSADNSQGFASPIQNCAGGTWKQVITGNLSAVLSIKTDGTLWGCGYNRWGQLGTNNTVTISSPIQIGTNTNWKQISCGYSTVMAIKTDGTLWGWGKNLRGQIGVLAGGAYSSPVQSTDLGTNWKQIAACSYTSMGIKTDGTLWGCGYNSSGQLGLGNTNSVYTSFIQVSGGSLWSQVAVGGDFSAAIKVNGTLWTTGGNLHGQLGINSTTSQSTFTQTADLGTNWKYVACGYSNMAGIKTDGTIWGCGYNSNSELGTGNTTQYSTPIQIYGGSLGWRTISFGLKHSSAIKTDGTLWSCGYNGYSQLGDGTGTSRSIPVQSVMGVSSWSVVAAGSYATVAIADNNPFL